jgi:hypothetical protein
MRVTGTIGAGSPSPHIDLPLSGGGDDINGEGGDVGGGRADATTSRMMAIAEGRIHQGQTRPWRRRMTTMATAPPRARPIR